MSSPVEVVVAELDRVSYTYRTSSEEVAGLRDVSCRFLGGQSTAVVGRSGSGKSTLISLLGLMRAPTSGRVIILGEDTMEMKERRIAAARACEIGVVFQSFHLDDDLPTWRNVVLPWVFGGRMKKREAKERAIEALTEVGIGELANRRPNEMSGGQRQRVAIARALMMRPKLFIADEPTGNLDEETADRVAELLFGLSSETDATVVVVTHDMRIAGRADRQLHLSRGELVPSEALH